MPRGVYIHKKGVHQSPNTEFKKGCKVNLGRKLDTKHKKALKNGILNKVWTEEEKERRISALRLAIPRGEKHYRWNPDREILKRNLRNDPEYKQWSNRIKRRDAECKLKNKDCEGYLIAHHIMPWSEYYDLRYELNNGITLCQAHHPRKREDEQRLMPILQGLVVGQTN